MRFDCERVLESLETPAGDGDHLGGASRNLADTAFFASEQFMRDLDRLQLPSRLSKLERAYRCVLQRPSATPAARPDLIVPLSPLRDVR